MFFKIFLAFRMIQDYLTADSKDSTLTCGVNNITNKETFLSSIKKYFYSKKNNCFLF